MAVVNSPSETVYIAPPSVEELSRRLGVPPASLVKLDANENPYGPPPAALEALRLAQANRYPDASIWGLRAALESYTGCPAGRIVAGNGSDELIDLLCRLYLRPGDGVVVCPPTFSLYALASRASGGVVTEIARQPGAPVDIDALAAAGAAGNTKIIFLCSPNNPTGDILEEPHIRRLLDLGPLVVLDEAYIEFAERSYTHLALEYPNLVVLRTFSKAFGLAGLRVGYGVFPEVLAQQLEAARLPYNVNGFAQAAAQAALGDLAWVERHAGMMRDERERLFTALAVLPGLEPLPSQANFLLVRVAGGQAPRIYNALLDRGIMVRYFSAPPLDSYLRISVGLPRENSALIEALAAILKGEDKS